MADRVAGTLAAAALLFAVGGGTVIAPVGPGPESLGLAATALAAAISAMLLAYASLNGWPTHRIVEASALAGAYADVVYAVEPAFLTDLSSRRFWRRRGGFAPTGLFRRHRRAAVLIHDLLVARRKAGRFWWLAGTATVPMVLAGAPGWVVMAVVLVGALGAAGTLTEATHVDSANAAMLRLLGLSGRRVMAQRLVVPSLIASAWLALALAGLQADGRIGGPWWVLGVVAGPAVAVAALHRARVSAVSVGNVLIDTPLGAFPRACCCGSPTASTCWRC